MKTIDQVISIIRGNKPTLIDIDERADLRKDLAIDSLDALMIMNDIDAAFSISIDEDDFKLVRTPLDIVVLLREKYGINEP